MYPAALDRQHAAPGADHGALLLSLVAGEGSGTHPWLHSAALNAGPLATRNLSDLLHLLTSLHASAPGMIETVTAQNIWVGGDAWLRACAEGFAAERALLASLTVAAGPSPSTPGEAATLSAVLAQRQALDTIARSDRFGCAIGAVAALMLDWMPIRATLDTAAERLGVSAPLSRLPSEEAICALMLALPDKPRLDRTLAFGARQLLLHHICLWDLLETRAGARED